MGEYAYDFTGENSHNGNCHNPWDLSCMTGGSSSGSGSATAAGLAPISLGSDTNGSIRVPSSLCGIFGLKPTYGRLPRTRSYPFCDSLDHLGPLARNSHDLALAFDSMQGFDSSDHACADKPVVDTLKELTSGIDDLKIARASGYFDTTHFPEATEAVNTVMDLLNCDNTIELTGTNEGRSAAFLITNAESSALHLSRLQTRADDFDPDTRYRFLAGTMIPAAWYLKAQKVRHWYQQQVLTAFEDVDVIIAPATPCTAPSIGQKTITINGQEQALRPNLGYFTQPFSAIGLPVCTVPTMNKASGMPIGVQIVAAPWREDICLRVAAYLESQGLTAHIPSGLDYSSAITD
jgi:AtzE family amidohydrolase